MDQGTVIDWYFSVPPVTRYYLTSIGVVAALCQLGYVGPLQLYFNYRLVIYQHQFWRLATPFLYFGPVNFDFLFHMFFLMRYCRVLEEESFKNKPADFLFMLLFGSFIMLCVGPLLRATFLSTALTFMIVYVWARRNPHVMMNFLGIFNFTAPYMPWVLLGFSLLLSGQLPVADVIGIVAGHAYYYLMDIYPMLYNSRPLTTPWILSALLNPRPTTVMMPFTADTDSDEEQENTIDADTEANNPNTSNNDGVIIDTAEQKEKLMFRINSVKYNIQNEQKSKNNETDKYAIANNNDVSDDSSDDFYDLHEE